MRREFKPTPVRLHHMPRWMKRLVAEGLGCNQHEAESYLRSFVDGTCGAMDHWGSTKMDGEEVFVFEPYATLEMGHDLAAKVMSRIKCIAGVENLSWWYPFHTIRIIFKRIPE